MAAAMKHLIVLLIMAGCASSKPTPYQKEKKKEGYQDASLENLKVSTFRGNSRTKKEKAQLYAQFRAIENCRQSQTHANMIDIFDKTIEKNIVRSSGSGWGPSYFGAYPYYSRYSSFGINAGFNMISSDSWNETLRFPIIEVYYTCSKSIFRPELMFKELNAEQMKHLVKDIKGAIQVENIPHHSLNKNNLELGDIILKANGKRIEKVYELIRLFNQESTVVSVDMLREGTKVMSKIESRDITSEVQKAEDQIISGACKQRNHKWEKELKKNEICINH